MPAASYLLVLLAVTPWLLSKAPVSHQDWVSVLQAAWDQSAHHADDRIAQLTAAEMHGAELVGWLAQWERRRLQLSKTAKMAADWDEDFEHLQQELHGLVNTGAGPIATKKESKDTSATQGLTGSIEAAIEQRQQQHRRSLAPTSVAFRWPLIAGGLVVLALTTGFWRGFNMTEWLSARSQDIYVTVRNFVRARLVQVGCLL
jgi:hypothetical protein